MTELQSRATSASLLVVVFTLGAQNYCIPVADVIEVVRLPALLTVAGWPPYVCGMLNHRGQYLPVLNGLALLGEPVNYALSQQILLVRPSAAPAGTPSFGLLVDAVQNVQIFEATQFTPCGTDAATPLLTGVLNYGTTSTLALDTFRLVELAPQLGVRAGAE